MDTEHDLRPVVYLLLGSNRGDREKNLLQAREYIFERTGTAEHASSLYVTEPWGFKDETPFLNQALEIRTSLDPGVLMESLLAIEVILGRIRPASDTMISVYTGRIIDIDILFYGRQKISTCSLVIPHPKLHERRFALVPLNEIAPELIHPVLGKSIRELVASCSDKSSVRLYPS